MNKKIYEEALSRAPAIWQDQRFTYLTREALKSFGELRIVDMFVFRDPIGSALDNALRILTIGNWDDVKASMGYDQMFHLYMIMKMIDGSWVYMEKNSNIIVRKNFKEGNDFSALLQRQDKLYIRNNKGYTLNQMLTKDLSSIGDENFFKYTAFNNNCQKFLLDFLNTNGYSRPEYKNFIYQDVKEICKKLPLFIEKLTNALSDLASKIGKFVDDSGLYKLIGDLRLNRGGKIKKIRA